MASSGVLITDQLPAMMMNSVASSTRKRLRADQSIRALSMAALAWLERGDHPFAGLALDELEIDGRSRFDAIDQRRVGKHEVHLHGRPFQAGDGLVRDAHGAGRSVNRIQLAHGLVADAGRLGG